jgi:hypothetical protein
MPSHDLKCGVAGAVRVGIMALGFVAFTGPAVMILSSLEASAREDGEKSGDDKSGTRVGAKVADRKAAAGTSGGVRIFRGLVGGDGAGVSIHRVPTNAGAASSPARANANTGAGLARTSQGTGAGPKAAFAAAPAIVSTAGVGIGNHPTTAGPTGTAVGFGGDSFASGSVGFGFGGGSDGRADGSSTISGTGGTGGSDIPSAFETLSRAQQARVMQRCKEVVARPALAEQNQLTICQVLLAMAKP